VDPVAALVEYVACGDAPRRVLLIGGDGPAPRAPRGTLAVGLAGTTARVGLAAQLLATGVDQVLLDETASTGADLWHQTFGDAVATLGPPRPTWRRPALVLLGQTPVPRRVLLGLPVRSALDLSRDDTDRTVAALALLRARGRVPADGPAGEHPGSCLVVGGCTACGVCVRACPTGALDLVHDATTSVLTHHTDRCRSTGACMDLCPAGAITSSGPATFGAVVDDPTTVVATCTTTTCPRCGARHVANPGSLCPVCDFRRTHVFGTHLDVAGTRAAPAFGTT